MIYIEIRFVLCALTSIIACTCRADAAPQADFEEYLKSHSLTETAARLDLSASWPKLDHASAVDRRIGLAFLAKCRQENAALSQVRRRQETVVYSRLINLLAKAGGYLNGVLQDAVYRIALSDIASTIVQHPEQAPEMEKELASLQPPWHTAGIGSIIADHFGDPAREAEFSKWPEYKLLARVNALFGKNSLFIEPSTSELIENASPHNLIHKLSATQCMSAYVLPGVLSYLKHGGDLRNLDGRDVTPFLALMGKDRLLFQFPMYSINELSLGHLIALRDDFGDPNKQSKFLKSALLD